MFGRLAWLVRWIVRLALAVVILFVVLLLVDATTPPISTLMLARYATGQSVDRRWVPLDAMGHNLPVAVTMSEDGQFCMHNGVDWDALHEVMTNPEGPTRGASTLTMQTAKNLFLWPGKSYLRKALEIPTALVIDKLWGKRRVLEIYLNIAEWGDGIYGAEAAAQHAFGKPVGKLTLREAALLATSLPNPFLRNPKRPTRLQRNLAVIVTERVNAAAPWVGCLKSS